MPTEIPWKPDTPQVNGRKSEKQKAKKYGAMPHSNSGAGSNKNDFSTKGIVYEDKNVAKTHTIKGEDLNKLFVNAIKQGKDAHYIIYFSEANITLEGELRRGR